MNYNEWSSALYRQLVDVNAQVNAGVRYVSDEAQFGQEEFWTNADQSGRGDCEDYAEAKYCRLRGLGWPKENLNFGICHANNVGHAVLIASLGNFDYVLDNNFNNPLPFGDVDLKGYKWHSMTKNGSFLEWYRITK